MQSTGPLYSANRFCIGLSLQKIDISVDWNATKFIFWLFVPLKHWNFTQTFNVIYGRQGIHVKFGQVGYNQAFRRNKLFLPKMFVVKTSTKPSKVQLYTHAYV